MQATPLGRVLSSVMADLFIEESEKKGRISLKLTGRGLIVENAYPGC